MHDGVDVSGAGFDPRFGGSGRRGRSRGCGARDVFDAREGDAVGCVVDVCGGAGELV